MDEYSKEGCFVVFVSFGGKGVDEEKVLLVPSHENSQESLSKSVILLAKNPKLSLFIFLGIY